MIAAVTAVFAIYDMFRIVQKISQVPAQPEATSALGGDSSACFSAAVLATLVALVRLLQH